MQDPPFYFPPQWQGAEGPIWNPYGPEGQLVDISSDIGATIGQQALSQYPAVHGWVRGEGNTAVPAYGIPGQPSPAEIVAALHAGINQNGINQLDEDEDFMATLLLTVLS